MQTKRQNKNGYKIVLNAKVLRASAGKGHVKANDEK